MRAEGAAAPCALKASATLSRAELEYEFATLQRAAAAGAPVVPVFALPLPGGRYRMVYEHPIDPPAADSPDAIREFTQRCTDVLEMYVRRHPELWLWMHRRWRDDGPAGRARGMFPAAESDAAEDTETRG